MDAGHLIALQVTLLYTLLSPLVLLAIYVLFDFLAQSGNTLSPQPTNATNANDRALWTDEDITLYLLRF